MKRITILIADDEVEIADLIALHLQKEGYYCLLASNGPEALRIVQSHSVDLAILDIMMPGMDGYELTYLIREAHKMPIIFVSAKTTDLDKITGLARGGDDYVAKPFNPMELVARVKAQLRRYIQFSQSAAETRAVLEIRELMIDPGRRVVTLYGKEIELTPKEFDILYLLARYPKKVFSTENIFRQVWGESYYERGNTVMVHIRTLRKKLGEDVNKTKLIKTVWGVGYTLNA